MRHYSSTKRSISVLGIAIPPLFLAAMGMTHPHTLTLQTASYWYTIHLILLPVFPLLGVNIWWLLHNVSGPWAWLARTLAFIYIPFYSALDVLAGIGTGGILRHAQMTNQPALADATTWLFAQGNSLAEVGVWTFLGACVITSALLLKRGERRSWVSALLFVAAAISFLRSHIYYPVGVLTMLVMAAGFAGLQWTRLQPDTSTNESAQ